MNKKYAIPSIVLIALMVFALIPMHANAFQTGPGSGPSDTRFQTFGPRPAALVMNVYGSYLGTFDALQGETADFMDSNLLATDYATIKTNSTFTTGAVEEFGLREFDMNEIYAPFNNTWARKGLSSLIDRNQWMSEYFPEGGIPAYTVLQAQGTWGNPALGPPAYYPQNFLTAYIDWCKAYGPPVADPNDGTHTYCTWNFPNPYGASGLDNPVPDPAGLVSGAYQCGQDQILFFIRTEQTEREDSGIYLIYEANVAFPDWASFAGNQSLITALGPGYQLPTYSGHPLLPRIDFCNNNLGYHETSAVTSVQVMQGYRFQLYTGGWSTGSTPDFMEVWMSIFDAEAGGWAKNAYNFGSYNDSAFDTDVLNCLTANTIEPPSTYGTAKYWSYQAQLVLFQDAGVIPWWIYAGYSATLSGDYNTENALGVGFGNWFSFFNAYKASGTGAGDTFVWGWSSDMHTNANPITSTWTWDWYMIGEIYDSLISGSPYDTSYFAPGLADNYSVGSQPSGNSILYFHLRSDVFWQDVPYMDRSAFAIPYINTGSGAGHELDGPFKNIPLTVLDVAFTYLMAEYLNYLYPVHINPDAADVDHVVISSYWNTTDGWPWSNAASPDPPWWNSTYASAIAGANGVFNKGFVQFDPDLDPYTINVYLTDSLTWLAYYTDMSIPIYPLHIFQYLAEGAWMHNGVAVPDVGLMNISPLAGGANLEYGTGPYIWTGGTAGYTYTMIAYLPGAAYGDIVERNGYFWSPVRDSDTMTLGQLPESIYYKPGGNTPINATWTSNLVQCTKYLTNYDTADSVTVEVTYGGHYDWWIPPGPWAGFAQFSQTVTVTIPPGGTVAVTFSFDLPVPNAATKINVHTGEWLKIVAPSPAWMITDPYGQPFVSYGGSYGPNGNPTWDYNYWDASATGELFLNIDVNQTDAAIISGDISAGTMASPYWGADGTVNILDVSLIAAHWLASWVPATAPTPTSDLGRADVNNDMTVNILDVSICAANWLKTWSPNDLASQNHPSIYTGFPGL